MSVLAMKNVCPACDEYVRRNTQICPECDYVFAFRGAHDTTDAEWFQLIDELSDQEQLYFTTNQLFIHWQRPRVTRLNAALAQIYISLPLLIAGSLTPLSLNLVLISSLSLLVLTPWIGRLLVPIVDWRFTRPILKVLAWGASLSAFWWFELNLAVVPPVLLFLIASLDYIKRQRSLTKDSFMRQLQRWKRLQELPMLITEPKLHRPYPELQGEAIYDYEVRQVLVVDQDLTVDLLTRNGLLHDQHLILISLNGYPEYSATFVRRLLTLHEDVTLYLLHRDGREARDVLHKVRALGFKGHRLVHLGWGARSRPQLVDHLGFTPREWDAFAVDSLPPESLVEGLPIAIEDEVPLVSVLGPRLRVIS